MGKKVRMMPRRDATVYKGDVLDHAAQVIGLSPDRRGGSGASMIGHAKWCFP